MKNSDLALFLLEQERKENVLDSQDDFIDIDAQPQQPVSEPHCVQTPDFDALILSFIFCTTLSQPCLLTPSCVFTFNPEGHRTACSAHTSTHGNALCTLLTKDKIGDLRFIVFLRCQCDGLFRCEWPCCLGAALPGIC